MNTQELLEDKSKEELKIKAERLVIIEKLRAMGFSEQEIEYNFSKSKKDIPNSFSGK